MKHAQRLPWAIVVILSACLTPIQAESDMKPQGKPNAVALNPVPDSEKEVECRVLDVSTGKIVTMKGRQAVYLSGPDTAPGNHSIPVSAFSYEGTHWIGLTGDVYIYRKGVFIGMAVISGGFSWLDNLAGNRSSSTLEDDIMAFRNEVPLGRLTHVFLRKWGRDSTPNEPECRTNFGDVIPEPYRQYLQSSPPGSSTMAQSKFVSAVFDGKLLKVTVSDQTGVMFPSMWVDLDTKKAIKVENYEYDPDAEVRDLVRWQTTRQRQDEIESTSRQSIQGEVESKSLQPMQGSEKEIECRMLDVGTGEMKTVKGRQGVYRSKPPPVLITGYPMAVSAFSYRDVRWVGLNCDLYLYRDGHLIGIKVVQSGLTWPTNYADNSHGQSLDEEIRAFQRDVTLDQLYDAYHRSWQAASLPGTVRRHTAFSEVIPQKYNEYLRRSRPGATAGGQVKFVSAAVDGKLLKVTVSNQSGVIFPQVWVDLDTKKAVKAENYEYDPNAKDRELLKR